MPDPAPDVPDDATESLAEAIWGVARLLRGRAKQALEPWDLVPSHARALGVLVAQGAVRPSTLSEHLRIAPRSATEVVDALQDRGLVERRPDPADRRATLVALTDEGVRVGQAIRAARVTEAEALFGTLDADDRAALARILRTLRDSAAATDPTSVGDRPARGQAGPDGAARGAE